MVYDDKRKKSSSNKDDDHGELDEEEEEEEEEEDGSEFNANFDEDGGAGAALSVNEREINMAKKLMQKVRNSKTLPKDRKLIELED